MRHADAFDIHVLYEIFRKKISGFLVIMAT